MSKIPDKVKKLILGISGLIFLILSFLIGPTNLFGLSQFIYEKAGYFYVVTISFLDYGLISFIPFFALLLNSKRAEFNYSELIIDVLIILFCTLVTFMIGLYILTFIGKPTNPIIPQFLITEPILIYSTILIGFGIVTPFMILKH